MKKNFILALLLALIFFKTFAGEGNLCLSRISENLTLCIQYDDFKNDLYLYEDEILKKISIANFYEIKIFDCKALEYKNLNGFLLVGKKSENSFVSIIYEHENNFVFTEIQNFDFDIFKIEQYFLDNNFLTFYCSGNKALYKINFLLDEKRIYNSKQIFNSLDFEFENANFYSQVNLNNFVCLAKISNQNLCRFFLISDLDEFSSLYECKKFYAQNLELKSYSCESGEFYYVLGDINKNINYLLSFDANKTSLNQNEDFSGLNFYSFDFNNSQILNYVNIKSFEQKCEFYNLKNTLEDTEDYSVKIFYKNEFFTELQSEKEIVFYQIFADSYDFILFQNGQYKYFCISEENKQLKLSEKNIGENLIYLGCSFDEKILNYFYDLNSKQIVAFLFEFGTLSKEKSFFASSQINSYEDFIQDFDCNVFYKNLFSSPSSSVFLSLSKKILYLNTEKSEFKIIETDSYTQSSYRWGISYIAYSNSSNINFLKIEAI